MDFSEFEFQSLFQHVLFFISWICFASTFLHGLPDHQWFHPTRSKVTIDGIVYVVDSCLVKLLGFKFRNESQKTTHLGNFGDQLKLSDGTELDFNKDHRDLRVGN